MKYTISEEEFDAIYRDAARYRWLVNADHWNYTPPPMRAVRAAWLCSLAKVELDAAIDAAMEEKK